MPRAPDDRVTMARQLRDGAIAHARAGRLETARDGFGEVVARFEGDADDTVRWLVADAAVAQADLLRRLGDGPGALAVRHRAERVAGDLIRPEGDLLRRELDAAVELADDDDPVAALDRLRRATCGWDGAAAPADAIDAFALAAELSLATDVSPDAVCEELGAWLEDAGSATGPARRAAFGRLFGQLAWAHYAAERREAALQAADDGLAYLARDDHPAVEAVVEWLREEREQWVPQAAYEWYQRAAAGFDDRAPLAEIEADARRAGEGGIAEGWLLLAYALELQAGRDDELQAALVAATDAEDDETAALAFLHLGRFLDFVAEDPAAARGCFERALAMGDADARGVAGRCLAALHCDGDPARRAALIAEHVIAVLPRRLALPDPAERGELARALSVFMGRERVRRGLRAARTARHRYRRAQRRRRYRRET